jgi:hypothetical protein
MRELQVLKGGGGGGGRKREQTPKRLWSSLYLYEVKLEANRAFHLPLAIWDLS